MPLTLAVLNDYPLVVAGLRAVLDAYPDRVHVVELNVGASVVTRVDVILQDTYASAPGALPVPRSATGPSAPKRVIFTWNAHSDLVRAARENGVDGYVLKSVSPDELINTLERISRGEVVFPTDDYPSGGPSGGPALGRWPGDEHGLSGRESEVLALVCQGLSNHEISQQAYIGINTVKTYIRAAYRKIEVTTRAQAVIWGLSHGFGKSTKRRTIL